MWHDENLKFVFFVTLFLVNYFFKAVTFSQPQGGIKPLEAGLSTKKTPALNNSISHLIYSSKTSNNEADIKVKIKERV